MKSILPAHVGAYGARYGYQLPLHFSHFTFYCLCISVDSVAITKVASMSGCPRSWIRPSIPWATFP